jgi:hypothetical protein
MPAPREVAVDSRADGYGFDAIPVAALSVGWIDGARTAEDGAVLAVSGWAGDPGLGLRIPYVGVGACGTIVASVKVDLPRPDVRQNVHPNLERAGWQARIFAAHLPDCADRRLEAYAFLPGGRALARLESAASIPDGLGAANAYAAMPAALVRPADLESPAMLRVRVNAARTTLRRCAGDPCAETASLARGEHRVTLLEKRDGWALIHVQGSERAGWLAETGFEPLPERLAQR